MASRSGNAGSHDAVVRSKASPQAQDVRTVRGVPSNSRCVRREPRV